MKKALIRCALFDGSTYAADRYVLFDDKILETGPMSAFSEEGIEIIDASGQLAMPSFTAGHTHVYSLFARGLSLPFHPDSFRQILEQMWWRLDRNLDNDMIYASGVAAAGEFLQNGVTAIIDHHASGKEISGSLYALRNGICRDGGMRGIFCFETSDRFEVLRCLEENRQALQWPRDGKSAGMFGLHAGMTLSEPTLQSVRRALGNEPIHIHVAEGEEDEKESLAKYGERIIPRLDRHGLLQPGSLISHAIHCDRAELALLKVRGCRIVLNVSSNLNNGVGLPDIQKIKKAGVPLLIGNDGLSSSITNEFQNVYYLAHHQEGITSFSIDDLWKMIDEANFFAGSRLGIKLGRIRPGYAADFLTVPYLPPTPIDTANVKGHLFFGLFPGFKPQNVFVAGNRLVTDYALDPALRDKCRKASLQAARLWDALRKEGKPHEPDDEI
jgi:cytosine/adenosine deaminase-related metal-dependent hydrolase